MAPISSARRATSPSASRSGAPSTTWSSPKLTPDHFFADVNGACAVTGQGCGAAGTASAMACIEALGASSAATSWASTSRTSARGRPTGISSPTVMACSVSVPVLSAHTTSTRASPSIAGSSCTSTRRRPSRITPSANAIAVSSTSPSGTIGTSDAVIASTASRHPVPGWLNCTQIDSAPTGTSSQET